MDRKQEDADIKSVQENPGYFRDLPPERKTENVCWHAVNADSANVRHVPEEMFSYEIVGMALTNKPDSIHDMPCGVLKCFLPLILEDDRYLREALPKDGIPLEVYEEMVRRNGKALEYVPEGMRTPEICRTALSKVKHEPAVLLPYVPYPDICLEIMKLLEGKWRCSDLMRSVRWNIIDDRMAEYAVSRDGYAISSVPVHLQTEKMVCQAAADTYNSALQLKSIRYDLKTEKAYLAGMDKNVPESFLNIPPDKRSAGICLQAEKWYPELLKKQPELIPDIVRNSCNVYSLNHKMEQCTGTKFSVGQIKKLYDGKALPVKEIWTPKGVMKDVTVSFDKRLKEFSFSPVRQIKRKGIKL